MKILKDDPVSCASTDLLQEAVGFRPEITIKEGLMIGVWGIMG